MQVFKSKDLSAGSLRSLWRVHGTAWLFRQIDWFEGGDSRPLVMPDTGAPDSAVQDAITDPFDIMPDEDGVDRCEQNETVKNVTLQPSDRSRDRVQLSRLLTPRVRKELELQDGVVGTAGKSKSAECQRITRRQAQSRVDDPDPSKVSSTMPKRVNLQKQDCVGA